MAEPIQDHQAQTPSSLAEHTAEIVSAYVGNHAVAVSDLGVLITTTANELAALGRDSSDAPDKPEPVVPIKKSVKQDQIICLICGRAQTLLKRHLLTRHELDPSSYRLLFGLRDDYPMAAPAYAARRSELAKKAGLGRKSAPASAKKQKTPPAKKATKAKSK